MPKETRDIFMSSRFEDLTYNEIAEKYGISPRKVKREIQNALEILRTSLKDYLPLVLLMYMMHRLWFPSGSVTYDTISRDPVSCNLVFCDPVFYYPVLCDLFPVICLISSVSPWLHTLPRDYNPIPNNPVVIIASVITAVPLPFIYRCPASRTGYTRYIIGNQLNTLITMYAIHIKKMASRTRKLWYIVD